MANLSIQSAMWRKHKRATKTMMLKGNCAYPILPQAV